MQEEKRAKAKKGFVAVWVGGEGGGKFTIPISYLYHPQFGRLLEEAYEVYGYHSSGPLKLPCSVDDFLRVCGLVEHESRGAHGHLHHHQRPLPRAFSFMA